MKKIIALALVLCFALGLCACGGTGSAGDNGDEGLTADGKVQLRDGRTGEYFDSNINFFSLSHRSME